MHPDAEKPALGGLLWCVDWWAGKFETNLFLSVFLVNNLLVNLLGIPVGTLLDWIPMDGAI